MKVAVLGAKGFIGSYLCTHLWTSNYDVLPVTRETIDLTDYDSVYPWLEKNNPDVVINAAISGGGLSIHDSNMTDIQNNLAIFFNFYNAPLQFKYINIGSGAEFDKSLDIHICDERDILHRHPKDSYGFSKNIIARTILQRDNFYTLRLFGCFGSSEPEFRLFKKFLSGQINSIQDRYFDYFSLSDFARVVEYYCRSTNILKIKDVNCVYDSKLKLSKILSLLKHFKKIDLPVYTDGHLNSEYTGSGTSLEILKTNKDFPKLDGLEKGLELYE